MLDRDKEKGQAILVIALLMLVLIALMALVIDGGNAYAQRRIAQNSVDAGVLAGIQALVQEYQKETVTMREYELWNIITDYTAKNGIDADNIQAWYMTLDGEQRQPIDAQGGEKVPKKIIDPNGNEHTINGIEVHGDLPFDTYFAHLLGFDSMTAGAEAKGWVWCGVCSEGYLFPIALPGDTFSDTQGVPQIGEIYIFWDKGPNTPGGFGWVHWGNRGEPAQGPTTQVLIANMNDTHRSGMWSIGEWVPASTGAVHNPPQIVDAIEARIVNEDVLYIPVYDAYRESGAGAEYRIAYFAAFQATCYRHGPNENHEVGVCTLEDFSPQDRWLEGRFLRAVSQPGEGVCPDGSETICTYKLRKPAVEELSP